MRNTFKRQKKLVLILRSYRKTMHNQFQLDKSLLFRLHHQAHDEISFFQNLINCSFPQILNIIENTCEDNKKASELCGALRQSSLYKKSDSVLKSPILVVLYCVSYNLGEEVTETL